MSNLCLSLSVGNQLAAMGHQRYDQQFVLIKHTQQGSSDNDVCSASYSGLQIDMNVCVEV